MGSNAEAARADQVILVERTSLTEIAELPINWDIARPDYDFQITLPEAMRHEAHLRCVFMRKSTFATSRPGCMTEPAPIRAADRLVRVHPTHGRMEPLSVAGGEGDF